MSTHDRSTFKNVIILFLLTVIGYLFYVDYDGKSIVVKTATDVAKVAKNELVTANLVKANNKTKDTILNLLRQGVLIDSEQVTVSAGQFPDTVKTKVQYQAVLAENLHLKDSIVSISHKATVATKTAAEYRGKYLQVKFASSPDTVLPNIPTYHYNAEIRARQFYKKSWILGSKVSFIDLTSDDSNTTINGNRHFEFKQASPTFGLRIQAISTYNILTNRAQMGFGAAFNAGKVTLLGAGLYDLELPFEKTPVHRYNFLLSTKYDLVRF
jgi:hypothetical protein